MSIRLIAALSFALLLVACGGPAPPQPSPSPEGSRLSRAPDARASEATLAEAAAVITPGSSHRLLSALASDEMMGRDTQRPEVWEAARFIAREFRAMGLDPMDEDGDFIDEYPISIPSADCAEVRIEVEAGGESLDLQCGVDFAVAPSPATPSLTSVVVSPFLDHGWYREHPDSIPEHSLVLTPVPPMETITDNLRFASWMENVWDAGGDAVGLIAPPMMTEEMMGILASQFGAEPILAGPLFLFFRAAVVEELFQIAGVPFPDLAAVEGIHVASLHASLRMPVTTRTITAPNVMARLPGTRADELKEVVLTAHFDHEPPGAPTPEGDSIMNGADDNASGTVGLLEVARAFAALPEPPVRSVVFAAVSAEEMGLLGSAYLAEHGPAPAASTAANLNMDMLSRNHPDSLMVFGQAYSSLGDVFRRVLRDHPELGFAVRPGLQWPELDLIRFSDQAPYLERSVPVLFFNSGFHPELHTPDDEVALADTDKLARASRLMFYLAYAVADDPADPVWTPEGLARVEGMRHHLRR